MADGIKHLHVILKEKDFKKLIKLRDKLNCTTWDQFIRRLIK